MLASTKKTLLQIGNIVGIILTILINALANALPLNGVNTGQISDSLPNYFVPAAITFSIWGVIYFLISAFGIYQAKDLFKKEKEELPFIDKIGFFFILASVANIAWIFFWHYSAGLIVSLIILSLVAMLVLFVALLLSYLRLEIGKTEVTRNVKLLVHAPISVYLGWITVATIANVTAVLVALGWTSFGTTAAIWTDLVIIVGTLITVLMLLTRKDIAYSLVIVWAYAGILIKRLTALPFALDIILTTAICTALIVAVIIWTAIKTWKKTE